MRALRLAALRERLRESLWFLPTTAVLGALVIGFVVGGVDVDASGVGEVVLFSGDADSARTLLATLLGALVTVTGLVLSITVVALQLASQQFSPRLLRRFLRDRGTQGAITVLFGTYGYLMAVLQSLPFGDAPAPRLAVTVGLALALVNLFTLVYFIHDITRGIRVEAIMQGVEDEAAEAIRRVFPAAAGPTPDEDPAPPPPGALPLFATSSGYLQAVDADALARAAARSHALLRLRPRIGDHVAEGGFLGWVWQDGPAPDLGDLRRLHAEVDAAIQLGFERTLQQDATVGLGQLVDMAIKALSPAVNDPRTAVEAVHHLTVLLCELGSRHLHWLIGHDERGSVRAVVERPSFADYLGLACDQIRRYGAKEPVVVTALLGMLANCAGAVAAHRRDLLLGHVELVLEAAEQQTAQPADLEPVRAAAHAARTRIAWLCRPSPQQAPTEISGAS